MNNEKDGTVAFIQDDGTANIVQKKGSMMIWRT